MKGQVIDKNIKLVREIGTGAFGSIFLGKNINSGRECAVKIEKAEKTTGLLQIEYKMYQHCCRTEESAQQMGLGYAEKYGYEGNYHFLIMKLLGVNLAQHVSKKDLKSEQVLALAGEMTSCIEALHGQGLVHRDIKPDNFCLDSNRRVRLIDLGLAKSYMGEPGRHVRAKEVRRDLVGTVRYASVNVHEGMEVSRRDDMISFVYSLASLLGKQLPWQEVKGKDKQKQMDNVMAVKKKSGCLLKEYGLDRMEKYVHSLSYQQTPDYQYVRDCLLGREEEEEEEKEKEKGDSMIFKEVYQQIQVMENKQMQPVKVKEQMEKEKGHNEKCLQRQQDYKDQHRQVNQVKENPFKKKSGKEKSVKAVNIYEAMEKEKKREGPRIAVNYHIM